MDPLFPDQPAEASSHDPQDKGYLHAGGQRRVDPADPGSTNHAADLARRKLEALYRSEPNAGQELQEVEAARPRSKHQQFMHSLSTSGQSLAEIQTAWHTYYVNLPDAEKHEVWQEFYAANTRNPSAYTRFMQQQAASKQILEEAARPQGQPVVGPAPTHPPEHPDAPPTGRSVATIKKRILSRVRANNSAQRKAAQHLKSLLFGLATGAIVIIVLLFGLFNQVVIAPFIRPDNKVSAAPIILGVDGVAPSPNPEVIIPKISVQLPVVYGSQTLNEADLQKSLEEGVIHYPTTVQPGQLGNAAFFGHSSNNIFNKGKYKFAFVLLHELVPGDIFYITLSSKVYTYKVFEKRVVEPNDTWVLNPVADKPATATLITCDPPGTSNHRLVVWGEQISPDPTSNSTAAATTAPDTSEQLPGEGPTLWGRFWSWLF